MTEELSPRQKVLRSIDQKTLEKEGDFKMFKNTETEIVLLRADIEKNKAVGEKLVARLEALEAKIAGQSRKPFVPTIGQPYFYLTTDAGISKSCVAPVDERKAEANHNNTGLSPVDYHNNIQGNCFSTKDEAALHYRKLNVMRRLQQAAGGFKPDWNDSDCKWVVVHDRSRNGGKWRSAQTQLFDPGQVYFDSSERAEQAIKDITPTALDLLRL